MTKTPRHNETFKIGDRLTVTALHTPCHTQDSICFYLEDGEDRAVFTGDTLFIAGTNSFPFLLYMIPDIVFLGCGRFFEGDAKEMNTALNEILAALPDNTKVYVSSYKSVFGRRVNYSMRSLATNTRSRM